jgi:Lrp/AsnC family leucine-responsive transcriptional regulator
MDEFDVKILNIVQRNNQLSTERIAEQVGLSSSAVQRRLKRLRKEGFIEADVSIISTKASGRRLILIVEITVEKEHPLSQVLDDFKRLMLATPEITQCYHVTGDTDFVLIIMVRDMEEYELLARRIFVENLSVRRVQTSVVVSKIKSDTLIPLAYKSAEE